MKRKIFCTIPPSLIQEPLLFTLGRRFDVIPNIHGASVTDDKAVLVLELDGEEQAVNSAVDYLTEQGVQIEELGEGEAPPELGANP